MQMVCHYFPFNRFDTATYVCTHASDNNEEEVIQFWNAFNSFYYLSLFLLFLVALLVGTAASSFVIIISIVRFIFLLLLLRQVFCVSRYFDLFNFCNISSWWISHEYENIRLPYLREGCLSYFHFLFLKSPRPITHANIWSSADSVNTDLDVFPQFKNKS